MFISHISTFFLLNPIAVHNIHVTTCTGQHVVAIQETYTIAGDGSILHGTELRKRTTTNGCLVKHPYLAP